MHTMLMYREMDLMPLATGAMDAFTRTEGNGGVKFLSALVDGGGVIKLTDELVEDANVLARALREHDSSTREAVFTMLGRVPRELHAAPGTGYLVGFGPTTPLPDLWAERTAGSRPADLPEGLQVFDAVNLGSLRADGVKALVLGLDLVPVDAERLEIGTTHAYRCDGGAGKGVVILWGDPDGWPTGGWVSIPGVDYEAYAGDDIPEPLTKQVGEVQEEARLAMLADDSVPEGTEFTEAG